MPENIDLCRVGPGWGAEVKSYWGVALEVPQKLSVVKAIKPDEINGFVPSRFMVKMPQELKENGTGRGDILVFSVDDVEIWFPLEV